MINTKHFILATVASAMMLASSAVAVDNNGAFQVTVGAGHTAGNVMAKAGNGDTVEVTGNGSMDVGAGTASISGTYVMRNALGGITASGAWHSLQFLSWAPTEACTGGFTGFVSGTARFQVQLDGIGKAHLAVTCHGCESPQGTDAITLKINGGEKFNQSVNNEFPYPGLFGDGRYMNLYFQP